MRVRSTATWLGFWLPASVAIHASLFSWAMRRHAEQTRTENALENPGVLNGGDTFDIDPQGSPESATDDSEPTPKSLDVAPGDGTQMRAKPRDHKSPTNKAISEGESTEGATVAALFGASGDRSAVDLATAFARMFPQTASADPAWAKIAMGSAGSIDVVLEIDDSGALVRAEAGGGGSDALRRDVERTLTLLRHRVFTASQRVTTLSIRARVSADAVHDDVNGNVFAVGGSFYANEGSAFFSLAIGRRIDVRILSK